jgi:hypothetical protein
VDGAVAPRADGVVSVDGPEGVQELEARLSHRWRSIHFECAYDSDADSVGSLEVRKLLTLDPRADLLVFASSFTGRLRFEEGYGLLEGFDLRAERGVDGLRDEIKRLEERQEKHGLAPLYLLGPDRPQVLVCLWEVDEQAGRLLMGRFYEVWNPADGVEAGEALFVAQGHVRSLERWAHPRYWAGWQLWGNVKAPPANR